MYSKSMILVLWPNKDYGLGNSMDECKNSLKRTLSLCEEYISKSAIYFLPNGLEQLKSIQQKKFSKNVHELLVSYYRQKKENIKIKLKRLIGGQIQFVKYSMKSALYSLLTSNDYGKALKRV